MEISREDSTEEYGEKLCQVAKDGDVGVFMDIVSKLPDDTTRTKVLHQVILDENNQELTPLFAAIMNGKTDVVRSMLDNWDIDLEQTVMLIENKMVAQVPALFFAAYKGHFDIVKILVEHGANIHHGTSLNSSPVRVACMYCSLDAVKYLVARGADIHLPSDFSRTTGLQEAAFLGRLEIVKYLIETGADIDYKGRDGNTALHRASFNGKLEVVVYLLSQGAALSLNDYNLTPLHYAASNCKLDVVECFISEANLSLEQTVEGLELLGASYEKESSIENAYKCLERAILQRQKSSFRSRQRHEPGQYSDLSVFNHIGKPRPNLCTTVEELMQLKQTPDVFFLHSIVIKEDILGPGHIDLVSNLVYRGAVFADKDDFVTCMELWLHALEIMRHNRSSSRQQSVRLCELFAEMIADNRPPYFKHVYKVLCNCYEETQKAMKNKEMPLLISDEACPMFSFMYCLNFISKLTKSESEIHMYMSKVLEFQRLDARLDNGFSTLHTVLDPRVKVDDFKVADIVKFPSIDLCQILVTCGGDVNARDKLGNTPLHILAQRSDMIPYSELVTLISYLIHNGAHVDARTFRGHTPEECAASVETKHLLLTFRRLSLKCFAATVIRKFKIPFGGQIPLSLEKFVMLH